MSDYINDDYCTRTPVALFVFNRPQTTARVFTAIAHARPSNLLIIADGPRPGRGDDDLCAQTRQIVQRIDWPCQVSTHFATVNLGCRERISSGLTWVFEHVESAIVLEDDCLPHPSFFRFCDELLVRHSEHPQVMHICGSNYLPSATPPTASYYFSKYAYIWGWATWRRAWRHYDLSMSRWELAAFWAERFSGSTELEKRYWQSTWRGVARGRYDTWDVQWVLSCIAQGGLSVVPGVNLVSNIGGGPGSTHAQEDRLLNQPAYPLPLPLRHPERIESDGNADGAVIARLASLSSRPLWRRMLARIVPTRFK